jgi:hypothetical protein
MKDVERRVEAESLLDYPSCDGDSCCPHLLALISEGDIDGKMDIKAHPMKEGKFDQMVNLSIVGDTVLTLALKKDQFNLIQKRTQPDNVRDDLIRIDVGGCRQLKGESSPIILEYG